MKHVWTNEQLRAVHVADEMLTRAGERQRLLREIEAELAKSTASEATLKPEEAEIILALGRMESVFQLAVAKSVYYHWKVFFNAQPWYKRIWQAWQKLR